MLQSGKRMEEHDDLQEQPVQKTDRFGFIPKENKLTFPSKPTRAQLRKETQRLEKWRIMMYSTKNLDNVMKTPKFIRRVEKGIPESFRGVTWKNFELLMIHAPCGIPCNPAPLLFDAPARLLISQPETFDAISKDLARTLPTHQFFLSGERGQETLETLLCSYALLDPEVGFTQGMSFIAALFLLYLNQTQAFQLFTSVMNKHPCGLRGMFKPPGMIEVHLRLYQYTSLLTSRHPKIAAHFELLGLEAVMYAVNWFATVFAASTFPFGLIVRVWDVFLLQGWHVVFGVALSFWKMHEKELLGKHSIGFEGVFELLRSCPCSSNVDQWMAMAVGLRIRPEELVKLEEAFYKGRKD